jgi:hypothetical protein
VDLAWVDSNVWVWIWLGLSDCGCALGLGLADCGFGLVEAVLCVISLSVLLGISSLCVGGRRFAYIS